MHWIVWYLEVQGMGQLAFGMQEARDTKVPRLSRSLPPLSSLFFVCYVIFSYPRWVSSWHRKLGCRQLWVIEIQLSGRGEKKFPCCSPEISPGKHSDWPSWDHMLTSLIYPYKQSIPILHWYPLWLYQKTRLAGFSENAC